MLSYILKYYFIYIYTLLICLKILNIKQNSKFHRVVIVMLPLFLSCLDYLLKTKNSYLFHFLPLIFIWIYISRVLSIPKLSFIGTIVSFGISYCLFALSGIVGHIILFSSFYTHEFFPLICSAFTAFVHSIIIYILFKIKRFQKGMPFLFSYNTINLATLMCTLIIIFLTIIPNHRSYNIALILTPFIFITSLLILIHWWQAQITKSYKQALINRELESLRMELDEKEKQLAELSTRNEELGRLIHKDNKRIPAMEHAVSEFLIMDFSDKEHTIERANALLLEIQKLSADRDNAITEISSRKYKHHNTGILELDTMLNYMEKRAYGEHIKLSVQIAVNLHDFIPNNIAPEDLSHILSDLLENAIIATTEKQSPVIQLQFYQADKHFVIEIADNGIPFEATSLVNFGLAQLTTHADTGGSGIGLMDIWKLKEKYAASLHITEYKEGAPYTKKIALIFNKKNRYTISTERKEELLAISKRTDLQIF